MSDLVQKHIQCRYCGEHITILVDGSLSHQNYVEDCSVCCNPIVLDISVNRDGIAVEVSRENE